jgi:hypothetical protein
LDTIPIYSTLTVSALSSSSGDSTPVTVYSYGESMTRRATYAGESACWSYDNFGNRLSATACNRSPPAL